MTQSTDCATEFEVTAAMAARHRAWAEDVTAAVWRMWQENGDVQADPETAQRLIRVVRAEYLVVQREKWMHPLRSIAVITGRMSKDVPTGDARLDHFDALRTLAGLSAPERAGWVGRVMGVGAASIMRYAPELKRPKAATNPGRTALYRHYDSDGTLLYIGISNDPEARFTMHSYTARWHRYSARCEIEWLDSRSDALVEERVAIQTERPLFNLSGSLVDPEDAEGYLLRRGAEAAGRIG